MSFNKILDFNKDNKNLYDYLIKKKIPINNLYNLEKIKTNINFNNKLKELIYENNINNINNSKLFNNINNLIEKNIKIIHIYQLQYINSKTTGLGDFLRSLFFMYQFTEKYKLKFEIFINHPIAKYFENYTDFNINKLYNIKTYFFKENNFKNMITDKNNNILGYNIDNNIFENYIEYLNKLPIINNKIYSYNIFFPYETIKEIHKIKIKNLIKPKLVIINYLNELLINLNLEKNKYICLHIRSGDKYILNDTEEINNDNISILLYEINNLLMNYKEKKIFLLSDNYKLKEKIKYYFPNIICIFNKILHTGEENINMINNDNIFNTLIEFYLMSYSKLIYAYSCYKHGTGFSYWCSIIYDIPYKFKYISNI